MKGPARQIDSFVLGKCTKFSHWFQRTTGRTNYFIAKLGLFVVTVAAGFELTNYYYPVTKDYVRPSFAILLFYCAVLIDAFWKSLMMDKLDESSQLSEERVTLRGIDSPIIRVLWLGVSTLDTFLVIAIGYSLIYDFPTIFYHVGFGYGMVIFHYFAAVNPLPPQKSKIRQWLESFSLTPATATSET